MPNLIDELGADYCNQMYKEALFANDTHMFRFVGSNGLEVMCKSMVLGSDKASRWTDARLPHDHFQSMDSFAWPKLGYRQLLSAKLGPMVFYITTQRSTMRGLREELLLWEALPIGNVLGDDYMWQNINSGTYLPQLFKPKFTPYVEGLEGLLAGKISGFAMSEDIAVGISCTQAPDRVFDIYFKQKVIGHIDKNGTTEIRNKIIKRTAVSKLFLGRQTA